MLHFRDYLSPLCDFTICERSLCEDESYIVAKAMRKGIQTIAPKENCPPVRVRVSFRVGGGGAVLEITGQDLIHDHPKNFDQAMIKITTEFFLVSFQVFV